MAKTPAAATAGKTLVIIEDNPLLAGLYRAAFEKKGVTVFVAHNGKSGLELVKAKKPQLIILDLYMSGMDGFAVLEAMQKEKSAKAKVIVCTVATESEKKEKAKKLGAVDYLVKPEMKVREIVEAVMKHL